jgi:glucose-6-phosphate isomerase
MPLRTDIVLDFNNMLAERIGPNGVQISEIEQVTDTLNQTYRGLQDLRKLGQLPFRDLPYQEDQLDRIIAKAEEIRSRCEAVLVLGTGGSSLGASCLVEALSSSKGNAMRLEICEDLHPLTWDRLQKSLPPDKTFLIVVSKSGKTIETLAAFLFFRNWMISNIGEVGYRKSVLFITDPHRGPLREIANREKIETLPVPPGVGGRYSVLSTVGLLPAACIGVEIKSLLAGARRMDERCQKADVWANPAMMSAALHYLACLKKKRTIRVLMPYDDRLRAYGSWFAQLWGESLGKRFSLKGGEIRAGITPVRAEGSIDQHSQLQLYLEGPRDKTITFLTIEQPGVELKIPKDYASSPEFVMLGGQSVQELLQVQRRATEAALTEVGCPTMTIELKEMNPSMLGQLLYLAEVETVFTGALNDINPFDQPGVVLIKNFIQGLLGVESFKDYRLKYEKGKKDPRYRI